MFFVFVVVARRSFVVIPLLYVFLNVLLVQETIKAFEFEFEFGIKTWLTSFENKDIAIRKKCDFPT